MTRGGGEETDEALFIALKVGVGDELFDRCTGHSLSVFPQAREREGDNAPSRRRLRMAASFRRASNIAGNVSRERRGGGGGGERERRVAANANAPRHSYNARACHMQSRHTRDPLCAHTECFLVSRAEACTHVFLFNMKTSRTGSTTYTSRGAKTSPCLCHGEFPASSRVSRTFGARYVGSNIRSLL